MQVVTRGHNGTGPIFIVGVPRSGTTLLRSMLCAHARIAIAPETSFLAYWVRRYGWLDLNREGAFEFFWGMFRRGYAFADLNLDESDVLARIGMRPTVSFESVFSTLIQMFAEKAGKQRWGEKTPRHHRWIGTLLSWYPAARILVMVRDPRSIVASAAKTPWGAAQTSNGYAREWLESLRRIDALSCNGGVLAVRYEALVSEPEEELKRVCGFVGEQYDPDMIERRSEAHVMSGIDNVWHSEHIKATVGPVSTTSIQKWKNELSTTVVFEIERICGAEMLRHGYLLERCAPPLVERLKFRMATVPAAVAEAAGAGARRVRDLYLRNVTYRDFARASRRSA